jgi:hypothetical protein
MLEQQRLLIKPWETTTGRRRPILDALTGALLGFAVWQAERGPRWLRWLTHPVLAVHEAEDEPLLFTVHRPWGLLWRWEVRDADGHPVGTFRRRLIRNRWNDALAQIEPSPHAGTLWFRNPDGRQLAALTRNEEGMALAFADELEGEPFVKMLLLASVLVLEPVGSV